MKDSSFILQHKKSSILGSSVQMDLVFVKYFRRKVRLFVTGNEIVSGLIFDVLCYVCRLCKISGVPSLTITTLIKGQKSKFGTCVFGQSTSKSKTEWRCF